MEAPAPKSPSPSREVPTSSTPANETPSGQQQQQQKKENQTPAAVQSPEDNRVSSMSEENNLEENPALQHFVNMFRFDIFLIFFCLNCPGRSQINLLSKLIVIMMMMMMMMTEKRAR